MNCLFCKIVKGEIPANKVYENDQVVAFRDINPVAPEHILVIPKKHIASIMDFEQADQALAGELLLSIQKIAAQLGLDRDGFRVVNNMGEKGGQTVYHIHFHLLGGRTFTWPPG